MNRRLAGVLTTIQPRSWRLRYGEEFMALLLELPASPTVVSDTIGHALNLRRGLIVTTFAMIALATSGVAVHHHLLGASALHQSAQVPEPASRCRTYSSTSSSGFVRSPRCLT